MPGFRAVGNLSLALLTITVPVSASMGAPAVRSPEEFTGVVLGRAGVAGVPFTLHVDRFSTRREVGRLSSLVGDESPRRVASTLAALRSRGWLRIGNLVESAVPVIREFPTPDGVRLFAVLGRPLPLGGASPRTSSAGAAFGVVELRLDPDGNGHGDLLEATRALFTRDGRVELLGDARRLDRVIGVTQRPVG